MEEGTVVVTINYRLGVLGFFAQHLLADLAHRRHLDDLKREFLAEADEKVREIQAKLDAKGVTGYALTIMASRDVKGHHIVGSCEGNTKKIALNRSRNAQ